MVFEGRAVVINNGKLGSGGDLEIVVQPGTFFFRTEEGGVLIIERCYAKDCAQLLN